MPLYVDVRFLHTISHLLRNFKKKKDYVWNFACPICGDSKKKSKSRGYVYQDSKDRTRLRFKCHNCGRTEGLWSFIKLLDPAIYKDYIAESFLDEKPYEPPKKKRALSTKPKMVKSADAASALAAKFSRTRASKPAALIGCPSIASLDDEHPAKQYIVSRKIPKVFYKQLFWTDDFSQVAKAVCPTHPYTLAQEGRILIPLLSATGKLLGIQGRSLTDSTLRYITIKTSENAPRIYGMHLLGTVIKRVYVVEGPFDSMFLPCCLAMTGSDIPSSLPIDKCVVIFDNEPRSEAICKKMEAAIAKGYAVVIWPKDVDKCKFPYKDINKMVLAGFSPAKIRQIIDSNAFTGKRALMQYNEWKKPNDDQEQKPKERT